MIDLMGKTISYRLFYHAGLPVMLPSTLALSVTRRCNARCRTCRVYSRKSDELTVAEYEKIFKSLAGGPRWITITGGEPFLRDDLCEIVDALAGIVQPEAVTIPTNGWYTERALKLVRDTVKKHSGIKFVLNISLDAIGEEHDRHRGLDGCFDRARETFYEIREFNEARNLHLGINTVISKYNIGGIPDLVKYVQAMQPDTHVFEPAQRRRELGADKLDIEPAPGEFAKLIDILSGDPADNPQGLARAIRNFRREYYILASKTMRKCEQVIPCYAGIVSAHISPGGNVWPCCTLASPMGNLRDHRYRFDRVWRGGEAAAVRKSIRAGDCYCTMANAAYSNIAMNPASVLRIAARFSTGALD